VAALTSCQGIWTSADSKRQAPKWTTVGVAKARPASDMPACGLSAIKVMTTNCRPISAPAADPTIT
jgi:hypothetical protein